MFDRFCDNVMFPADSNHGYKMIGVGKLVAKELLSNQRADLKPFRFSRYAEGDLHPTSNSHFPELAYQTVSDALLGHEPDTAVRDTLPELVSPCLPTPVNQPRWVYFNDALARQIGLSRDNVVAGAGWKRCLPR